MKDLQPFFDWVQSDPTMTQRCVFGAMGIFKHGVLFAYYKEQQLYLRSTHPLKSLLSAHQRKGLPFQRGNKLLQLSYYQVDQPLLSSPERLLKHARQSVRLALRDRQTQLSEEKLRYDKAVKQRLKLPPIGALHQIQKSYLTYSSKYPTLNEEF